MSIDTTKEDANFANALHRHRNLSSVQILTIHLLREVGKGRASRWHPYVVQLPRFHQTLAYFSELEAKAFQVEDAIWVAERASRRARLEWEEARPLLMEIGLKDRLTTLKAWLWASATVSSRTLHVPWNNAGALCPIGDLFNYAPPDGTFSEGSNFTVHSSECTEEFSLPSDPCIMDNTISKDCKGSVQKGLEANDDAGCSAGFGNRLTDGEYVMELASYCFYARKNHKRGEQVHLCYGVYSNLELLEHYGFLLPHNPNEEVSMTLPGSQKFTMNDFTLSTVNLRPAGNFFVQADGRPSFSLLAALRLHFTPRDLSQSRGYLALSGLQISIESDVAAYTWLLEKCKEMVGDLPTTLEGDTFLLATIRKFSSSDSLADLVNLSVINDLCGSHHQVDQAKWKVLKNSIFGLATLSEREQEDIFNELNLFLHFYNIDLSKQLKNLGDLWLERWRLSVEWRLGYKRILHRCITFCAQQLQCITQNS